MPLIIICGFPSSGKTIRALQLKDFFEKEHAKTVHLISEEEAIQNAGFNKNSMFLSSQKEIMIRAVLKSDVFRLLNKDDIVILDSSNYIKGFRYELYCGSKAFKTTQCTIYTIVNNEQAWTFNTTRSGDNAVAETYSREAFDALVQRFEEPDGNNRWDSPLYVVGVEDEIPLQDIQDDLYHRKPPPPNLSTQNAPLTATNFLFEVDRITGEVCDKVNASGAGINPGKMRLLRRQFLTLAKFQYSSCDNEKIAAIFTHYLHASLRA